ncbi:Rz1 family lipoprotein [Serratia marcescens]|nr:Rz1 family lipoprotein [Serratia marcescens]MCX2178914.1 Rz1 family lipoprotein [Serratia marcescens]
MALASCSSPPCAQLPAPPAWLMLPVPDLLTPMSGIISVSERESK